MQTLTNQFMVEGDDEFTVHILNSYGNVYLGVMQDYLEINSHNMRRAILGLYKELVRALGEMNINYSDLRPALIPSHKRNEAAYIFCTHNLETVNYGHAISEYWLHALKNDGPEKTAIHHGDIVGASDSYIWKCFDEYLIHDAPFTRVPSCYYYVIYFTNLTDSQLRNLHKRFTNTCSFYMGYVDCTIWNPLKFVLRLPQYGLRIKDTIITLGLESVSNLPCLPLRNYGFNDVGVEQNLYDIFLHHKINNGSSPWSDNDSSMALQMIRGERLPVSEIQLDINASRLLYLNKKHRASLERAQLHDLDERSLIEAIKNSLKTSVLYDIRFKKGTHDGMFAPENDAVLFSTQIELSDSAGFMRRYQVGIKYKPFEHSGEIVTFY